MTSQWARWCLKSPASPLFTQPFFRRRSKITSTLRVTGLCAGNSPMTGEFPAQKASNAENVSIWWRHHVVNERCRWLYSFVMTYYPNIIGFMDVDIATPATSLETDDCWFYRIHSSQHSIVWHFTYTNYITKVANNMKESAIKKFVFHGLIVIFKLNTRQFDESNPEQNSSDSVKRYILE